MSHVSEHDDGDDGGDSPDTVTEIYGSTDGPKRYRPPDRSQEVDQLR